MADHVRIQIHRPDLAILNELMQVADDEEDHQEILEQEEWEFAQGLVLDKCRFTL